jgi:hypothetical protein
VAAVVQAVLIGGFSAIVLTRAGILHPRWSRASTWLVWLVVGFSVVAVVLNLLTPSAGERAIWAPIAAVMMVSSSLVALSRRPSN